MPNEFREMWHALNERADGLIAANRGIKKAAEAAIRAQEEHEDLRESVRRLEQLVIELLKRQQ